MAAIKNERLLEAKAKAKSEEELLVSARKNNPQYTESMAVEMERASKSKRASLKKGRLRAVSTRNRINMSRVIRAWVREP